MSDDTVELITNLRQQFVASGLDAGAETIAWHLQNPPSDPPRRIDKTGAVSLRRAGQMHHISIGRAHAGTPVVLLIADLDIRVIATATGELLRRLTLDPTRCYQPRQK